MADSTLRQIVKTAIRSTRKPATKSTTLPYTRRVTTAATQQISQDHTGWTPHHIGANETNTRSGRLRQLKTEVEPRPFSSFLTDNYAREHDYLRISVTERCNLRCLYCMPEEGVPLSPPEQNLSTPEIVYLSELFVNQGVTKIRLTGGEPTVRKDIVGLMQQIGRLRTNGLKELCITTNGISLHRKLDAMVDSGLTAVNLSLDTLDPFQFTLMTRRNGHEAVMKSINRILEMKRLGAEIKLKINCVVMRGINEREILPFVEMGREQDIEVRFIEYMPFDGNKWSEKKMLPFQEMLGMIESKYPDVYRVQDHKNDTSKTYKVPGFTGRIGFITSMTHNFCGTCNRLRITSNGNLKTCLFGNDEVSLRDVLRESNNGRPLDQQSMNTLRALEEAQKRHMSHNVVSTGTSEQESRLLDIIGMAVKRKKEKHAGIDLSRSQHQRVLIHSSYSFASSKDQPHRLGQFSLSTKNSLSMQQIRLYTTQSQIPHNSSGTGTQPLGRQEPLPRSSIDDSYNTQPLNHLDEKGHARMVDISQKPPTSRSASAVAVLLFSNDRTYQTLTDYAVSKGDAQAVARIAAIQAAKKTPDLIPLAHPSLNITGVAVDISPFELTDRGRTPSAEHHTNHQLKEAKFGGVSVKTRVDCDGRTGVEMEALTAALVGAATLYDMLKGIDKGMRIVDAHVTSKRGGKSGDWRFDEISESVVHTTVPLSRPERQQTHLVERVDPEKSDIEEWNEGLVEEFSVPADADADTPKSGNSTDI